MEWFFESNLINFSLILSFFYVLYYYGTSTYSHWKDLGVAYIEPKFPFLGNFYQTVFSLKPLHETQVSFYNHFKGKDYAGVFNFRQPSLLILKPELVESVLIKDFNTFYNRGLTIDTKLDPLSSHLFNLENAKWKNLRNKLAPTFTSGKLKGMHQQLIDCSLELTNFISKYEGEPFEAREVMAKFTTDVISSCAFGLNANALQNPDSEFRKFGKRTFEISFLNRLRSGLRIGFPSLVRFLKWKGIPAKMEKFFINTIKETVEYREKNNIKRPDFLHLMNELKNQDLKDLAQGNYSNEEKPFVFDEQLLAANAFVFFVAGFETTASTLSYAMYEMAKHPIVQEKAYQEVASVLKKYNDEPTYEATKEMNYLGQIISETLRKYPPVATLMRKSTKPYHVPETPLVLPSGFPVQIPVYSIQNDPRYFNEPEKFIPERFSDENKEKIKKGTYLPFGDGPRICIGLRFAQLEMKVALAKILITYRLHLNKKTISPFEFNTQTFFMVPKGGIWMDIEKRI